MSDGTKPMMNMLLTVTPSAAGYAG